MACILGISAYYHDSAAVLIRDGDIVAAAQEERFSRRKHDPRFPHRAVNYCLGEAFIEPSQIDAVAFYDNPLQTLDRVIKNALTVAPRGKEQFLSACESLLGAKANLDRDLESCLGEVPRLLVTSHHMAHAASCFLPSPFESAAILTMDGVGEWTTCSIGSGSKTDIKLLQELKYPHSLGLLYSAFTAYCGFKVNSGEYKLMGLAPYGEPIYAKLIRDKLIDIKQDGSFRLETSMFGFLDSDRMTNEPFNVLFGGPARIAESPITRKEMDLAASVQQVIEEIVLKLVATAISITGHRNLTMAGGVALNCVANGRILRESGLQGLFIQPAAGDAGGALGAALLVSQQVFGDERKLNAIGDSLKGCHLGPKFSSVEVEDFVDRSNATCDHLPDHAIRAEVVAKALADGMVVGFFSGRMEFGPRALGARSILGDARRSDMQKRMNLKIKFRESFRPFAPAILEEYAAEYFCLDSISPYMLVTAPINANRRIIPEPIANSDNITELLSMCRSDIPAVTHVNYSARVQTVGENSNPEFLRLLRAFHASTGCPVLINTSFNVRGEPMVCTPDDAYQCFMRTGIDLLVLEDRLFWKDAQPAMANSDRWKETYELD